MTDDELIAGAVCRINAKKCEGYIKISSTGRYYKVYIKNESHLATTSTTKLFTFLDGIETALEN